MCCKWVNVNFNVFILRSIDIYNIIMINQCKIVFSQLHSREQSKIDGTRDVFITLYIYTAYIPSAPKSSALQSDDQDADRLYDVVIIPCERHDGASLYLIY